MTDNVENLVLEYLRRIDLKVDALTDDMRDLKLRASSVEMRLSTMQTDIARVDTRLDRADLRLERIEKRLGLVEV